MAKKKSKKKPRKTQKKSLVKKTKEKIMDPQDKILRNIIIISSVIVLVILFSIIWENRSPEFNYKGVEFSVVEFCDAPPCLITYNTKLPVIHQGRETFYNFYLRNHPKELDRNVPFNGDLKLMNNLIFDVTYDRACDGYSSIAVENLATLIGVSGIGLSAIEGGECDMEGKNMYVLIQEGEETKIEQIGPACYTIDIKECEVLKGTERFMTELFVEINKNL